MAGRARSHSGLIGSCREGGWRKERRFSPPPSQEEEEEETERKGMTLRPFLTGWRWNRMANVGELQLPESPGQSSSFLPSPPLPPSFPFHFILPFLFLFPPSLSFPFLSFQLKSLREEVKVALMNLRRSCRRSTLEGGTIWGGFPPPARPGHTSPSPPAWWTSKLSSLSLPSAKCQSEVGQKDSTSTVHLRANIRRPSRY